MDTVIVLTHEDVMVASAMQGLTSQGGDIPIILVIVVVAILIASTYIFNKIK